MLFNFMLKVLCGYDEEPRHLSREGRKDTVADEKTIVTMCILQS